MHKARLKTEYRMKWLGLVWLKSATGTVPQWHLCRTNKHGAALYVGCKRFLKWPGRIIRWRLAGA